MLHISSHAIKTIELDIKTWSIGISMFRRRIDRLTRGKMQQKQTSKSTVHIISVAMIKANATYANATTTPKSSMPNASSHSFSQHAESQLSVSQRQPQNARLPKKQNKINRAEKLHIHDPRQGFAKEENDGAVHSRDLQQAAVDGIGETGNSGGGREVVPRDLMLVG
jgi:hypothetical protein